MRRAVYGSSVVAPRLQVLPVPPVARSVTLPPPVQGLDAISPLAAMSPQSAITLKNIFPQPGYVEIRKGHRTHNSLSPVVSPVESLMPYHAPSTSDDKLFAAAGTSVFDVTATASATIPAAITSLANARLQHLNFSTSGGNFLWFCNGADTPQFWDGSTWAVASIANVTAADAIGVAAYSERIWMILNGQISPAYLPTDSVEGSATVFDLTGVFNLGGYLQAMGSWSRDGGQGPDDYAVFVTSKGEVAVYAGDPGANPELVGVYEVGAPIGRRCLTKVGPDLGLVCVDGVVPISRAINTDRAAILNASITAKIQPLMNTAARNYNANFGWQLTSYPRGTRAILNIPVTENSEQFQYIMNTITGAWCEFNDESANCWTLFQDRLFYGDNSGLVKEADCQGFDDDGAIEIDIETAFTVCENDKQIKQFGMCRSLLTTDGQTSVGLALNVDFARGAEVSSLSFPADPLAQWNVGLWDAGVWPEVNRVIVDWTGVEGEGYFASIRMKGSLEVTSGGSASDDAVFKVNGWNLLVQDGEFI